MRIEFQAEGHVYRIDGAVVPSVTQLLKPLECFDGIPVDRLEAAREFGQHLHHAIDLFNRDDLRMDSLDPRIEAYLRGYMKFLEDTNATVVGSETPVASAKFGYAGMLDLDAVLRGKGWTIDVKSTDALPCTVGPQTAAYEAAYLETFGPRRGRKRACLHLKRGAYKFHELKDPTDWSTFLSCRNIHVWRSHNAA